MPPTPGRRPFLAGSIVLLLFGAVHAMATISERLGNIPPELADADAALRAASIKIGPMTATAHGLQQILSISYTLFLVFLGAINLTMARPAMLAGRLRTLAWLNFGLCAGLFGVAIANQFPPPALFALLALVCFGLAAIKTPAPSGAPVA